LPCNDTVAVLVTVRCADHRNASHETLGAVDKELAGHALADAVVRRLMTIPGIDAIVALSIVAAVGDFGRFPSRSCQKVCVTDE
jgi:transposase